MMRTALTKRFVTPLARFQSFRTWARHQPDQRVRSVLCGVGYCVQGGLGLKKTRAGLDSLLHT